MKSFSKFKKQIDNLFDPNLKMEFCCYAYPMRSQRGCTSIPRFCIKLGKEIIWDCPKNINVPERIIHYWSSENGICDLVRDYIDAPLEKLLEIEFKNERWLKGDNVNFEINYGLTDIFKAGDRRLGKTKLINWAKDKNNGVIDMIIEKRFSKT